MVNFKPVMLFLKIILLILHRNEKGFLLSPGYKDLKGIINILEMKRAPDWRKPAMYKKLFLKKNLFKEWMKKFVALLIKKKTAKNEWENDDSDFLQALYSVYKKIRTIFFFTLTR